MFGLNDVSGRVDFGSTNFWSNTLVTPKQATLWKISGRVWFGSGMGPGRSVRVSDLGPVLPGLYALIKMINIKYAPSLIRLRYDVKDFFVYNIFGEIIRISLLLQIQIKFVIDGKPQPKYQFEKNSKHHVNQTTKQIIHKLTKLYSQLKSKGILPLEHDWFDIPLLQ